MTKLKDARTIPPEQLYERRKQAIALFKKGMNRIEIGEIVGVRRDVVGKWIAKWKAGGLQALKVGKPGKAKSLRTKSDSKALNRKKRLTNLR